MAIERMTSVWVDFNSRIQGYVPAYVEDADGSLEVGATVYAWDEFEDGLRAPAVVVAIDEASSRVLLEVEWDHVEREDSTAANARLKKQDLFIGFKQALDARDPRVDYPTGASSPRPRVRESHVPA